jgi:hypothetical protein
MVKECGPRVGHDEISYVPPAGMCMGIALQMSSSCSLTQTHAEQGRPITWFTYGYSAGCRAARPFYEFVH